MHKYMYVYEDMNVRRFTSQLDDRQNSPDNIYIYVYVYVWVNIYIYIYTYIYTKNKYIYICIYV